MRQFIFRGGARSCAEGRILSEETTMSDCTEIETSGTGIEITAESTVSIL
jgi:hypothetical protein